MPFANENLNPSIFPKFVSKLDDRGMRCIEGVSPGDVNAFCIPLVATAKFGLASQIKHYFIWQEILLECH